MKGLFSEFRDISFKEWKNKANFDLKGEVFNEILNCKSLEGINIPTYFSSDSNSKKLEHTKNSNRATSFAKSFIFRNDKRSINIFRLFIKDDFDTAKLFIPKDFKLSEIINIKALHSKNIQFDFEYFDESFVNELKELSKQIYNGYFIYLNIDIIGKLSIEGNWTRSEKEDFDLIKSFSSLPDNIIPFAVNTIHYQNAGANIVQQISYALATAVEYADLIGPTFFKKVQFNFAIGSNFFLEIAKISAFDYLMNLIKLKYNSKTHNQICCESTRRNKTIYDAHNNLLRSGTEAFSALLSNVDTFVSFEYDSTYNNANKTSSRLGYNQLNILNDEAYASKVENVAEGSYYINFIKYEFAEKALEIFKLIESGGGILKQIKDGIIQRKVNESSQKEQSLFNEGKIKIIGSNFVENKSELMDENIRKYPFIKLKHARTIFNKIYPKRLSEEIEKNRLKLEKHNRL